MILIKIVILNIMIVEKKEVNPNTYEEINITIKIEYPNIEYNDWKRTKEFNRPDAWMLQADLQQRSFYARRCI